MKRSQSINLRKNTGVTTDRPYNLNSRPLSRAESREAMLMLKDSVY